MKASDKGNASLYFRWIAVVSLILLTTILTRGLLDRINSISVSVQSLFGDSLDLGHYSGLQDDLSDGFSGTVFNIDKVLCSARENDYYDDNLSFEKNDGSVLIYYVKNDCIYSLRIDGYKCELKAVAAIYPQQSFFGIVPFYRNLLIINELR